MPNTTVTKGRDADLLSIPEAAALPGLSAETAYRLARRGELPGAVKLGRSWLISRPRLLAHFTETAAHDRWVWADWCPMSRSTAHPPASHQSEPHPVISSEMSLGVKGCQTLRSTTAISVSLADPPFHRNARFKGLSFSTSIA